MSNATRALLLSLALASCAPPGRRMITELPPTETALVCPALPTTQPLAPTPIPPRVVALLPIDGAPPAHNRVRAAIGAALDRRGFSPRSRDVDPKAHVDFILWVRYTAGPPQTATFVVHDVAIGRTALTIEMLVLGDDLIGPVILPTALAHALADHVLAQPPITDDERAILADLDEPVCFRSSTEP